MTLYHPKSGLSEINHAEWRSEKNTCWVFFLNRWIQRWLPAVNSFVLRGLVGEFWLNPHFCSKVLYSHKAITGICYYLCLLDINIYIYILYIYIIYIYITIDSPGDWPSGMGRLVQRPFARRPFWAVAKVGQSKPPTWLDTFPKISHQQYPLVNIQKAIENGHL